MIIDRSKFSAEELKQYEALTAKARVQDDSGGKEVTEKKPVPELAAALKRLERLEKIIEHSQLAGIARKYSMLGEDEEKLTDTLGKLRRTDEASYNAYIAALDKSLELVHKSGLFAEIGKSGMGLTGGSVLDRIQAAADEIQRADPKLSRAAAIARAWESHPELAHEYDMDYQAH